MEKKYYVFVYGTLKKGEPNHPVLVSPENGSCDFFGNGQTIEKFPLIIATEFNIPFMLNLPTQGHHIHGEVYVIDNKMLEFLDKLEVHPSLYKRELQVIEMAESKEKIQAWIYLLNDWNQDLIKSATEHLPVYNSLGIHGRVFTNRAQRIEILIKKNTTLVNLVKRL